MADIDFNSIFQQIMDAQKTANVANVQRYNEILSSLGTLGQQVDTRFTEAAGQLAQLGEAGRTRIKTGATKSIAASEQDLISRGLGTSTIRMTAQRGIMSDAERARQELEEGLAAQRAGLSERRAGAEMQIGGMKAGVMERRTDAGPDLGLFASLIQAAAASEKADAAAAKRTSTIMGPMAQAGRDVFGQPFKYGGGGGGGLGAQGGGISGGGGADPTGGRLAGAATGASRTFDAAGAAPAGGPGGVGFFGQQGMVSTAPAGEQPWAPGAGGEASIQREPEAGIVGMAKEMAGPEFAGKIGLAPEGGVTKSGTYNQAKYLSYLAKANGDHAKAVALLRAAGYTTFEG